MSYFIKKMRVNKTDFHEQMSIRVLSCEQMGQALISRILNEQDKPGLFK